MRHECTEKSFEVLPDRGLFYLTYINIIATHLPLKLFSLISSHPTTSCNRKQNVILKKAVEVDLNMKTKQKMAKGQKMEVLTQKRKMTKEVAAVAIINRNQV